MGAEESSMNHTEGQLDGGPVTFFYKQPADGDEDKGRLSWTEGYKVYPESKWTHTAVEDILIVTPMPGQGTDEYQFLYVQEQAGCSSDAKSSPIALKKHVLKNPPFAFVQDWSLPSGESCPETRMDVDKLRSNFHIIVSSGSGTGLANVVWNEVVKPFLDHMQSMVPQDIPYELHFTTSESSVADLTKHLFLPRANQGVRQGILLMSGDGGVLDIVNTLLSAERTDKYQRPNVSLLPLGTGNALAHSAGITANKTLGLRNWIRGIPKELPLFAVTFSTGARALFDEARQDQPLHLHDGVPTAHGAVVCSWGLHAGLVADSDTVEYRKFGAERFKMAAKEALFPSNGSPPHAYKGDVCIQRSGQEVWEPIRNGEHGYVLATLVSQLEKGFTINPQSRPLDGKLRLIHFGPISGDAAMEIMGKAYQGGRHTEDERVGYDEIEALRISFHESDPRWRRVCIDGKIIRVEEGGWMEVRAGQKGVVDLIVES